VNAPSAITGRRSRRALLAVAVLAAATGGTLIPARPAAAAPGVFTVTSRVSVSSTGGQLPPLIDYDVDNFTFTENTGRHVFFSVDQPLQADDTNQAGDVYRRDRLANLTERVSLTSGHSQIAGASHLCGLSDTGRYVGFVAGAANLPGGAPDEIYLRDLMTGTTKLVSQSTDGVNAGPGTIDPDEACPISTDGRYVAFTSTAATLVDNDTNNVADIFRRDLLSTSTLRASVSSSFVQAGLASSGASMSDDGNMIAFETAAANLIAGDTNGEADVYVRQVNPISTSRVSLTDGDAQSLVQGRDQAAISGNGRYVAFRSRAADLVADDTNGLTDIFLRDRQLQSTEIISVASNEFPSDGNSTHPTVSDDGRYVTFSQDGTSLYPIDSNDNYDAYRRDRALGTTDLLSRTNGLPAGNHFSGLGASLSADGQVAAFISAASNLVRNDTDGQWDVFVHDFHAEVLPFGSADGFIDAQYHAFAGRSPSSTELTVWKARIANGEQNADTAIDAFAHSATWSAKRAPLLRLYWAYFHRMPDQGGLNYWLKKFTGGMALTKIASHFAASSEFQTKTGGLTNEEFVVFVYDSVLDRKPDAGGLAFWVKRLGNHTKSRGDLMANFSESSEGVRHLAPPVDVLLVHLGMMGALPSQSLFDSAVATPETGDVLESFIQYVRGTADYALHVS
jgi:hypothetical protein